MLKTVLAPTLDDALQSLADCVAASEQKGGKNLVFCEDRLTLLAERAIVNRLGGTFDTEVTTLARFLADGRRVLSKYGSVMEISALIEEHGEELKCFRPNSASAVYETIAQLSASRISAQTLRENAEATDGFLRWKLSDLAFLLERYNAFLAENGLLDENGYLSLLPEKLSSGGLHETNVFFFAFGSFTKQAREGICAAAENAKSVTGIFLGGAEEIYTNEAARAFLRAVSDCGEPVREKTGCTLSPAALRLLGTLFAPELLPPAPQPEKSVRAFFAEDETDELNTVAALIKKYVAEGLRYRDIAVLVPDGESFLAVEKVFSAYRIPFYADKKRSFAEHPFCAFVLAVLRALHGGVLPEDADAVCANVCFGESGEFRNYLLKYGGYRGAAKQEIKTGEAVARYDRDALCACREKLLAVLSLFPKGGKGSGASFVKAVRALRELVGWEPIAERLGKTLSAEEKRYLDLKPLENVLCETETVAGGRTFSAREFAAVLENGMSALKVSMIPQYADAVYAGDMTESRIARVKVLFAVGLTDEVPRVCADTAVIGDGEIKRLSALQTEIEPAIEQVNRRAREALALNLCAFEKEAYFSCSLRRKGTEANAGEIIRTVQKLFDMPPMPALYPYDCSEKAPATLNLLAYGREREKGGAEAQTRFFALCSTLGAEEWERADALLYGGEKGDVAGVAELYFKREQNVSPTLLESYFACPYAGFASRGLRLREREERTVLDTDAGSFVHAVLEEVGKRLNDFSDEAACRAFARETGELKLKEAKYAALTDTAAGAYTGDRLIAEGEEVSAAAYRQLARSAFRVLAAETRVEIPDLELSGTADRIDAAEEYVRVIDYKTGAIDDSPTSYYTGRKLQLELYLSAAAQGKRAAGAFYFPAADVYAKPDAVKYRMKGFYSGEANVVSFMDVALKEGEKSELFEGTLGGRATDKGMAQSDFEAFLEYSLLVSDRAEREMKAGNIRPSPYEGACAYCKLKSLCAFTGEPRKEESVKCSQIAALVKKERGEL